MRTGALFAGYGGLEMAVNAWFGATTAWVSEIDPGACAILAHHWPDVPNLGDITKIRWTDVPRVDILTGGSPCQDLSHAGKRKGMTEGTRSNLWVIMREAIAQLRPPVVVWENVRGALSAEADSDLGSCPGCLDDPRHRDPLVLRALGRVLGDLSELGYDAQWTTISASDVGAPHGRARVFLVARDAHQPRLEGRQPGRGRAGEWAPWAPSLDAAADTRGKAVELRAGLRTGQPTRVGGRRPDHDTAPHAVADASRERHGRGQDTGGLGLLDRQDAGSARQRERPRQEPGDRGAAAAPAHTALAERGAAQPEHLAAATGRTAEPRERPSSVAWGPYEPAIRRWERVLGRPAPAPTETSSKGGQRLSPAFVEWMMGLPVGHVTDPAIWVKDPEVVHKIRAGFLPPTGRNAQLKALGNGVVPQQAYEALRRMAA